MRKVILIGFMLVWKQNLVRAQIDTLVPTNNPKKPLEFTIPTSAAFDLLGVTPAQVTKPGNIRDFKVDWSFASWRLKPNIAIQAQPIWELLYNRPNLNKYWSASKLMKMLSTVDFSAGTVEDADLNRRLAVATKITLLKSHDALDQPELFSEDIEKYYEQRDAILLNTKMLQDSLKKLPATSAYVVSRSQLLEALQTAESQLALLDKTRKDRVTQLTTLYIKEHWNASFLDVAIGKVYNYENVTLDSLSLKQNGFSVWVNGCVGFGHKWLLTGMFRYTQITKINQTSTNDYFVGLNLRYGSPKFNFFIELLNQDRKTPFNFKDMTVAYGGDWRMNRNVVLSYGVRTLYDTNFSFKQLIPIASISCMMR
jgi:hypothetical protein